MAIQSERAETFASLHVRGRPVVLFNIWDAGSAKAVAGAGASALATGSWPIAAAHGFEDAEQLPLDLALANLERIVAAVDLPVSLDFESGYGRNADEVAANVERVVAAGAVGINLEDRIIGGEGLYAPDDHAARVAGAVGAGRNAGIDLFVNARTDLFLKAKPESHDDAMLDEALARAHAYEAAGAGGFFAPGLVDEDLIARLCEASPLPVNVLIFPASPSSSRLAELGVARISYGPGPWRRAMAFLEEAASEALAAPGHTPTKS